MANTNERWRTKRSAQEAALLDEILLDETTADLLGSTIEVRPVVDMVDLDQEPMRLSSLVVATTPG